MICSDFFKIQSSIVCNLYKTTFLHIDVNETVADVAAGDVIDALMTDSPEVAAAEEPASRHHDSDVNMTSSSPTPRDLVIKEEVVDDAEEDGNGFDADVTEQRRPASRDGADDDGVRQSNCSGDASASSTLTKMIAGVDEQLDRDGKDCTPEKDFPSAVASAAAATAVAVLARSRSTWEETEPSGNSMTADKQGTSVSDAERGDLDRCRVCGDEATGMYFGALVCVPCKVNRNFDTSL